MLKKFKHFDWNDQFAYRPPLNDVVINTDQVIDASEYNCDRCGKVVKVTLTDKRVLYCDAKVDDFVV